MSSQDEIASSLGAANDDLRAFTSALNANVQRSNIVKKALDEDIEAKKKMKAAQESLASNIAQTAGNLISFGKSLINGQGSFQPLTQVVSLVTKTLGELAGKIPFVGGVFKGLIEGAGEAANFMIEQFDRTYGIFEKLSDSGVVSTFTDLKEAAQGMNLSMADAEASLTKHSKNLALFAGSAIDGRKQFQSMAASSAMARTDFQKLGISSKEFNEMQISYLNQQMRITGGQKQTADEMTKGSLEYIKEMDLMAKLTGQSRQALVAEREARMSDARYMASMSSLPKEIRDNIDKGLDATTAFAGKELSSALQDVISTDGAGITKGGTALVQALSASGVNVASMVAGLKDGSMSWTQMMTTLSSASKKNTTLFKDQAALLGAESNQTMLFVGMNKLALKDGMDWQKALESERVKQAQIIKDTESDNAKLAETKQAMENLQKTMEQMATDSGLVSKLLPMMAEGIEDLTIKLFSSLGMTIPPLLLATRELRVAQKEETQATVRRIKAEEEAARTDPVFRENGGGAAFQFSRRPSQVQTERNQKLAEDAAREEAEAKAKVLAAQKKLDEVVASQTSQSENSSTPASSSPPPTSGSSSGSSTPSTPSTSASPTGANNTPMPAPAAMPSTGSSGSGSGMPAGNTSSANGSGAPVSYTPGANGSDPKVSGAGTGVMTAALPTNKPRRRQTVEGIKEILEANADKHDRMIALNQQNADAEERRNKNLAN